jgi:hypothetical protein
MSPAPIVGKGILRSHGRQEVAAAGTPEALGSGYCTSVMIQALEDNTDKVTIGASDVDGADATRDGIYLNAGDIIIISA